MTTALTRYGDTYKAEKAMFNFMGASFRIFAPDGKLSFFVKQKAFKLKEQITVFADEGQSDAMLGIQARSIMDVSATYDVTDSKTGEKVGAMRRKGLKSIFKDEWSILDADDNEIGLVKEDSGLMALIRRFLLKFLPQTFIVSVGGHQVGAIQQTWNIFKLTYQVDFSGDKDGKLDRRLAVAMVVLLLAIEGRQKN